jgi:hypothetical protein
MSTMTLRKRISLATVSAVGAALLTIVPISSANAASGLAIGANGATGATAGTLGVGAASSGLLGSVSGSGTTQTATLLSTGALGISVGTSTTSSKYGIVTVTGGTISAADGTDAMNSSQTLAGCLGAAACGVVVKPNSGVSTMTVQVYDDALAAGAGLSTAGGTLTGQVIVTIAATSQAGVYSSVYSKVNTVVIDASDTTVDGIDEADSQAIANGGRGMINYILKDAYGTELPDSGAIVISATGGGLVAVSATVGADTAAASILNTTAVTNDNTGSITVKQSVANAPLTTTVTISYNGVVVGTKSFTFAGEVAKVAVDSNLVSAAGGSSSDQFRVKYYDAAGTRLYPSDDTSLTTVVSTTVNQFVSAASVAVTGNSTTTAAAKGSVTCGGSAATGAGAGSADLQLQYVNASGTIVKSNVWKHTCAGDAATYKASFDKASYTPGSIAVLTVSAFDASGKPTHAGSNNIAAASDLITCAGCPNANVAVTAPADSDVAGGRDSGNAAGTITYKYVVGTTEGDFVAVVEAEEIMEDGLGLAEKQTVNYSVKVANAGVTNAEVLKSIVALIASINKQIQALQKLILRR